MKQSRTLKIPVAWLLFPLIVPICLIRIALALVVGTIRIGECGYKAEILERSEVRGDLVLAKPDKPEWRYGKRYKVKMIPSIGWKLLGEKTHTFVCYRVHSLEKHDGVFDWPEYRLEDGSVLAWPEDKARAISRAVGDLLRAAKEKKRNEEWEKWKKAVDEKEKQP